MCTQEKPECGQGLRTAKGLTHALSCSVSLHCLISFFACQLHSLKPAPSGWQERWPPTASCFLREETEFSSPDKKKKKEKIYGEDSDWLSLGHMLISRINQLLGGGGQQGEMEFQSTDTATWGPMQLSRPWRGVSTSACEYV